MAMSAEHWSKFAAYRQQWWRLHMSEKLSIGTINPKQKYAVKSFFKSQPRQLC